MDGEAMGENALKATIGDTFDVLSWELELAAARCIYLDSLVGRMLAAIPDGQQADFVEGMHTVDLLSQQLTSLSAFARRMSGDAPDVSAYVHKALSHITLGALADRMSTALGGAEKGIDDGADAGELDLF